MSNNYTGPTGPWRPASTRGVLCSLASPLLPHGSISHPVYMAGFDHTATTLVSLASVPTYKALSATAVEMVTCVGFWGVTFGQNHVQKSPTNPCSVSSESCLWPGVTSLASRHTHQSRVPSGSLRLSATLHSTPLNPRGRRLGSVETTVHSSSCHLMPISIQSNPVHMFWL